MELHPNAIQALARCGQGYSLSDEGLAPVAYPLMPAIPAEYPLRRNDEKAAQGAQGSAGRSWRSDPGRVCSEGRPRGGGGSDFPVVDPRAPRGRP